MSQAMTASNPETDSELITLLADSAADFCTRRLGVERLRGLRGAAVPYDRASWREMCELGWSGILAPETAGGLGLGASALGVVCRELGRVVAPEPMLECGVAAGALLTLAAPDHALVRRMIAGEVVIGAALATADEFADGRGDSLLGVTDGDQIRLSGHVRQIPLGTALDHALLALQLDGAPALVCIDVSECERMKLREQQFADGTCAAALAIDGLLLGHSAVVARGPAVASALVWARQLAQLATSAYLLGLAEQAFSTTLEYLKTRHQFGRAIGSFQALQHRAVDLYIQQTIAAAVIEEALADFDRANSDQARALAAGRAKYRANEAALLITRQAVQLHGGIGYTDECDVGLYLNRALVLSNRHGTRRLHAGHLAQLVADTAQDVDADALTVVAEPANGEWEQISDETFRHIVRRFFEQEYPAQLRYPSARLRWNEIKPWYMTLSQKGWVAPAWPAAHGGMGLSPAKLLIYIEEQERWGVGRAPDMGIQMVGPLLIRHGTDEQRARYLPKILSGDSVWCQGYSEPNAGSDLASLRTEAAADGDEFVINGQKTWTTLAQDATHMFCLARTSRSGKPQEGISFFLIDLDQPGVTIRPIRNIAGHEEFCEVFLDNVRVPADCLVGGINRGWSIAKALLGFERIFIGSPKQSQYCLMRLETLAAASGLIADGAFRDRLIRLKLDVLDLESTYQRFADIVRRGEPLGADVSLLKIWGTETFARLSELMVEAAGAEGAVVGRLAFGTAEVDVMSQFYNARPATIYGGSNEIQRNIIAKNVLSLPA